MKKIILAVVITALVAGGSAFYFGMKYGEKNSGAKAPAFSAGSDFRNRGEGTAVGPGLGFLSGEVLAKDEKTLTIKTADGGSKIVFFSDSTRFLKTSEATIDEIEIGEQVVINGKQNSDASYTAQTIQLGSLDKGFGK